MYIDHKTWNDFENYFCKLKGQFLSPGGVAQIYGVRPQAVTNWIRREKIIDAHRFAGNQGTFLIIPIEELSKIDKFRNKELFK